jgi:hypothetical protein
MQSNIFRFLYQCPQLWDPKIPHLIYLGSWYMLITAELAVILTLLSLSLSLSSFEILAVAAKCVSLSLSFTHTIHYFCLLFSMPKLLVKKKIYFIFCKISHSSEIRLLLLFFFSGYGHNFFMESKAHHELQP